MWDPAQYLRFGDERSRPFFDLVGQVRVDHPSVVVDLGCGPGQLTATLADRWRGARVHGIDADQEMLSAARRRTIPGRLSFASGDVTTWRPDAPVDVIVSNAVLQWVPEHERLLPEWVDALAPGGWIAFQVPGNFDQPSHVIMRELISSAQWRPLLADVKLNRSIADPADYADLLSRAGCTVDAWETTYLHLLPGDNPIIEWYKGSGLRPVLAALNAEQAEGFLAQYGARLQEAYPRRPYGTILPFRRVFVVARRAS